MVSRSGRGGTPYGAMNPKSGLLKRLKLGNTVAMSVEVTPNQRARVALYSSTEVVGIQRPWLPESSGPPSLKVGTLP
ncbi:MAG: hypothetical protein QOJ16_3379 [Acidobacteriota bacterium]|nr:hypothetical protein [Acidobacteriota bacterium]